MPRPIDPRPEVARVIPYDVPPPEAPIVLAANESPYGLPHRVRDRAHEIVDSLEFNRYPDPTARGLREAIGRRYRLPADHVLVGNGGDELLYYFLLAYGGTGRLCLSFPPTFAMYGIACDVTGTSLMEIQRDRTTFAVPVDEAVATLSTGSYSVAILCTPNNPTGTSTPRAEIVRLVDSTNAVVLVDEAYAEFGADSMVGLIGELENLIVMRTFSKAFSLAGLRVGYVLGQPATLAPLAKVKLPYNADAFSQALAQAALEHAPIFEKRWEEIVAERQRLAAALAAKPNTVVYPSHANFLCVRARDPGMVAGALADAGILVRDVSDYAGLDGCVRITVGSPEQNDAVIGAWPDA